MINVLDHMTDPCRQLQKAKNLLAPEGILYLRFPNGAFHSFLMRTSLMVSSRQFMNRFLVFHEYAFTPRAISRILQDMGFSDVRIFNSRLTGGSFTIARMFNGLIGGFFKSVEKLSGDRLLWGPSLEVIAYRERTYGDTNINRWRHGRMLIKMLYFAMIKIKFIG